MNLFSYALVFLCVSLPSIRPKTPARRESHLLTTSFLSRLALLTCVCLQAQCTPVERAHQGPPQVPESTQPQTLTPEEQLELFNTFLDRG